MTETEDLQPALMVEADASPLGDLLRTLGVSDPFTGGDGG
jgi:hypothetical protein